MPEQEGVIKYQLDFTVAAAHPYAAVREVNAWRKMLYMTELIGQNPNRYDGYGYGNISQRVPPFDQIETERAFIISGTQTGHLADLTEQHYSTVLECYPDENRLVSAGPMKPSSEALTHGTVYALDATARCVMHAHSPSLWEQANRLGIPTTRATATYGSPEMSAEIRRLFRETDLLDRRIFVMLGHVDGVVAFGPTVEAVGVTLLTHLAKALQLS